jgi:hypothetical protein
MARHECPDCETVFLHADRCPGCGWSASKAGQTKAKVAEGYTTARPPTYPEPSPGDDALIRAEIARAKALLNITTERPRRAGLPDVDPAIREKLKGAPR